MSSSSSDSDSDEFEPIRKIKINIRPKEEVNKRAAADVNEIKASIKAWRPLGPPTHPSLSRRQSSLSSVSSMTFGTSNSVYGNSNTNPMSQEQVASSMRSSPSCSSLVNEFNNRSSFSNFMSTTSRTSSPLTLLNHSDPVPIAIAIQESIELIIEGHYDPSASEPKFESRYLGNIKVAFPNAFARGNFGKPGVALKLRLHSTDSIIRYYASRLIKDLDLGNNSVAEHSTDAFSNNTTNNEQNNSSISNGDSNKKPANLLDLDPFEETKKHVSPTTVTHKQQQTSSATTATNHRLIEFDMEALQSHLRKMYDQSPTSRYFNVDVLRYQIAPITSIEQCPLQVCAYWKVEADLVKLRIDFKHSSKSGQNLERLREISFTVNFSQFIPPGIDINSLSPDSISAMRLNNNNNHSGAMNMNNFETSPLTDASNAAQRVVGRTTIGGVSLMDADSIFDKTMTLGDGALSSGGSRGINVRIPDQPMQLASSGSNFLTNNSHFEAFGLPLEPAPNLSAPGNSNLIPPGLSSQTMGRLGNNMGSNQHMPGINTNPKAPYITYEPQAYWNNSIKQLSWKFDTLLSYYKTDGLGSLFAKLDFRNYHGMPTKFLENCKPSPVDVKFLIIDSTISKISLSIDSIGYKMSLLKKEIRSGRYRSEPYIL